MKYKHVLRTLILCAVKLFMLWPYIQSCGVAAMRVKM